MASIPALEKSEKSLDLFSGGSGASFYLLRREEARPAVVWFGLVAEQKQKHTTRRLHHFPNKISVLL